MKPSGIEPATFRLVTQGLKWLDINLDDSSVKFLLWVGWLGFNSHFFFIWHNNPQWARASSFTRFLDHTQRRTTVSRIPLDEWSVRRRDLYLTTHNTHNRQTSMPPVEFGPTIPASERPQTYALDRAATGTGTRGCTASFIKTGCTCANNLRLETLNVY